MCPPLVLGPILYYLNSLDNLNTSNQRVREFTLGKYNDDIPVSNVHIFIDMRDPALRHVLAIQKEEASDERFFAAAGYFSNQEISAAISKHFPDLRGKLPDKSMPEGEHPEGGVYTIDKSRTSDVLGIKFRPLEDCIADTVRSLQAVSA